MKNKEWRFGELTVSCCSAANHDYSDGKHCNTRNSKQCTAVRSMWQWQSARHCPLAPGFQSGFQRDTCHEPHRSWHSLSQRPRFQTTTAAQSLSGTLPGHRPAGFQGPAQHGTPGTAWCTLLDSWLSLCTCHTGMPSLTRYQCYCMLCM